MGISKLIENNVTTRVSAQHALKSLDFVNC